MKLSGLASFFLGVMLLALVGIFFSDTIASLLTAWETPEYSYGYLVFPFSLYWGWKLYLEKRPVLKPAGHGVVLAALAAVMHITGDLAANNWIDEYAIVVMAMGILFTLLGAGGLRAIFPAVFFLSFAVPLPPITLAGLTAQLQLFSSTLSVAGLQLLGISVFQEGNIVDLGTYKLQVAEACSGLRYLFPFMSFGYLFAFMFEKNSLKRIVIFLATIPITILMNAFRIMVIGITVDRWGIAMAEGVLHQFEGWVVFVGCIFLLFLISWLLSFIKTKPPAPSEMPPESEPRRLTGYLLALVLVLSVAVAAEEWLLKGHEEAIPQRQQLAYFPLHIGDWQGSTQSLPQDQLNALKLSDYFLADYSKEGSPTVNFYIAYYATQRRTAAPHSPLVCMPGAGWEIASLQPDYALRDENGNIALKVNRALIKNGDNQALVYFWYDERGRNLTDPWERKWYLFEDAVARRRSDGALVRAVISLNNGMTEEDADRTLTSFVKLAAPLLPSYVPN